MPRTNPILNSKSVKLIATLTTALLFAVVTYGVYRSYNPGPDPTDIADYPEMLDRFNEIYPW